MPKASITNGGDPGKNGNGGKLCPAWEPGKSANPGGRPKGFKEFRELCRENAPVAMGVLLSRLADNDLRAAELLLAYAWGRPPQPETGEGGEGPAEHVIRIECNGIDLTRRFGISPVRSSFLSTTEPIASP